MSPNPSDPSMPSLPFNPFQMFSGVATGVAIFFVILIVLIVIGIVIGIKHWNKVKCDEGKIKQNVNGMVLCVDPNNPPPIATIGALSS